MTVFRRLAVAAASLTLAAVGLVAAPAPSAEAACGPAIYKTVFSETVPTYLPGVGTRIAFTTVYCNYSGSITLQAVKLSCDPDYVYQSPCFIGSTSSANALIYYMNADEIIVKHREGQFSAGIAYGLGGISCKKPCWIYWRGYVNLLLYPNQDINSYALVRGFV